MDRATVIRKVRACLRLAASPNPNEAAAALRQAHALMAEYGVSADEADPDGICDAVGKTRQRGGDIHYRTWLLAATCARLFGCYVYAFQHLGESTVVRFIGVRPAPELAEYAFTVLRRQLDLAVTKHLVRVRKARNRHIRAAAFGESWVMGLRDKLGDRLAELPPADKERFQAYAGRLSGGAITTQEIAPTRANYKDSTAGYLAGRAATLNQGVTGSSTRLLEVGNG